MVASNTTAIVHVQVSRCIWYSIQSESWFRVNKLGPAGLRSGSDIWPLLSAGLGTPWQKSPRYQALLLNDQSLGCGSTLNKRACAVDWTSSGHMRISIREHWISQDLIWLGNAFSGGGRDGLIEWKRTTGSIKRR